MNIEKTWQEQSEKIWELFSENKYSEARDYISDLLKIDPDSHFLLTRLSSTYYEEFQYQTALEHVEKALKLAPKCPLVLWDYAGTLDMLERNQEAIAVYRRLIRRGIKSIAYDECGEGVRWARSLINDCRYRLGLIYARIGNNRLAKKCIQAHINHRNSNTPSIYHLTKVKNKLKMISGTSVSVGKNLSLRSEY